MLGYLVRLMPGHLVRLTPGRLVRLMLELLVGHPQHARRKARPERR